MNQELPLPMQMLQIGTNKLASKPVSVAAKLKIADILLKGPQELNYIAAKTETHAPSLYRVLRACTAVGVFEELPGQQFQLNALGEQILDREGSVRGMVLWFNDPAHDKAWSELLYSVRTGKNGFEEANGMPVFEYFRSHPETHRIFNEAMVTNASFLHAAAAESYDFGQFKVLFDIGGGLGSLMSKILVKHPSLKGGVFDLEECIDGAKEFVEKQGVLDRCELFSGDFFESVPEGADAHMMSFILHDWSDDQCIDILRNCYKSLPNGGKLLIIENVIKSDEVFSFGKLLDIEMLVMTTGRERTTDEFKTIAEKAGFKLNQVHSTKSPVSIVEIQK